MLELDGVATLLCNSVGGNPALADGHSVLGITTVGLCVRVMCAVVTTVTIYQRKEHRLDACSQIQSNG